MARRVLPIVRPTLAAFEDIEPHLRKIWDSHIVTNSGPYHDEFEKSIAQYLGVEHVTLVSNATLGLMLGLRVLGLTGEVITTPFSFVATSNAIKWAGLTPVFADIDPETLNLDPVKVASMINGRTSAILPVHTFGRVCDTQAFRELGDRYSLATVYDAAHTFGVQVQGESVSLNGDISVLSLHATKVFNSVEGGLVMSRDAETKARLDALRNNGIDQDRQVSEIGLNAKMSELHAAIGLIQLKGVQASIAKLELLDSRFRDALAGTQGIRVIGYPASQTRNFTYFPIVVGDEYGLSRDELWEKLTEAGISATRYFYPLIPQMPAYRAASNSVQPDLSVAVRMSESILCLPMLTELAEDEFDRIVNLILKWG